MKFIDLCEYINLQPEIISKLNVVRQEIDLNEIELYLNRLMDINTAKEAHMFLKDYFVDDTDKISLLYCHLECARRIYSKYQEKNIPDEIFVETMRCFTRFINECEKKNGRMFFDRAWWTYRQISMNIFRIGELEYEMIKENGENVISIHIPSDAVFTKEAVDESFRLADEFFCEYYPEYRYDKYICDSWLLSPVLKDFLPEESNIRNFMKRFEILEESSEGEEYIEW